MKFVPAGPLVQKAREEDYAVPALNTNGGSYDITRAALEAAQKTQSPVIIQVYEPNTTYRGYDFFVQQCCFLAEELDISVPVALQVDHGHSFESVIRAMKAGMTSVMFDASHEPIEENIRQTRAVVEVAQSLGVSVEAEIGYVKGNEQPTTPQIGCVEVPESPTTPPAKTTLEEAVQFAQAIDVDMLAVSVGTTHGVYRKQSEIDFDLLAKLREAISIPLVQHGTCGISLDDLTRLIKAGMAKINFGEPFRFNYIRYFNELADTFEHRWHPWKIQQEIKKQLCNDMIDIICAVGSDGRA